MNEEYPAPINQFSDFGHQSSYLPHDFWPVVLIFLPIALLLTWLLHRRFPNGWISGWIVLRSAIAACATVSLTYPIRYFFWLYDARQADLNRSLSGSLFRHGDVVSLPILLALLFVGSVLFSLWLRHKARNDAAEEDA